MLCHTLTMSYQIYFYIWFQVVVLISQIRVNSMTIVRMKSSDIHGHDDQSDKVSSGALTSSVEQVRLLILVSPHYLL